MTLIEEPLHTNVESLAPNVMYQFASTTVECC